MRAIWTWAMTCAVAGCASRAAPATTPTAPPASIAAEVVRPPGWAAPEVVVPPSAFHGVHGLAIDAQGRLLAGTVVGNDMWEVDRKTGAARVFIANPEGEADDIAIGPKGELAWTSYTQGIVRYREREGAPTRELARDLRGINSLAFDRKSGKLYASQVFYADALWEIDVAGKAPPRLIAKDLGGFNGFEVGPDGQLYGPLWFKGKVVKIDPKTGALHEINGEFHTPAALNLDGRGSAWVIDTETGEVCKVALATGTKTLVKKLAPSLDNLAIAPEGTVYVSNMADGSIEEIQPGTGASRTLVRARLATPGGIALDGERLYVADVFSLRTVDAQSGDVRDVLRAHAAGSHIEYPMAVAVGEGQVVLTSWATGTVQRLDRATQAQGELLHDFKAPTAAVPLPDGSLLVTEIATGALLHVGAAGKTERRTIATLEGPTSLALGPDGAAYVLEAAGRLTRVDLASGEKRTIAEQLQLPDGIARTPWGSFIVAESAAQRLTEIDPTSGSRRTVAEALPIGFSPGRPGVPPPFLPTGVACARDGTIFVSADRDQSLLRIRPAR